MMLSVGVAIADDVHEVIISAIAVIIDKRLKKLFLFKFVTPCFN